jgi:hypothetical protein
MDGIHDRIAEYRKNPIGRFLESEPDFVFLSRDACMQKYNGIQFSFFHQVLVSRKDVSPSDIARLMRVIACKVHSASLGGMLVMALTTELSGLGTALAVKTLQTQPVIQLSWQWTGANGA